jgi:hypothetical protein
VISDTNLIGWIVMLRYQFSHDDNMNMPRLVREELIRRGWLWCDEEEDWEGKHGANITEAGGVVADTNAPEWGINPIPEEV